MNLLSDASFETLDGWSLQDHAVQWADSARTGAFGVLMPARLEGPGGQPAWNPSVSQTVATDPGIPHELSVYVRHGAGTGSISIGVTEDGAYSELASIAMDDPTGEWERLSAFHAPTSATSVFEVHATGAGTWDVDDAAYVPIVEALAMKRCIKAAWIAAANRLMTIRKEGGYAHDSAAVIPRLETPATRGRALPYICLPLEDDGTYEIGEDLITVVMRLPVYVFVGASAGDDFAASSGADISDWADDVVRCMSSSGPGGQWDIGDAAHVDYVRPAGRSLQSEPLEGFPPHARIEFEIQFRVTHDDIGS